MLGLLLSSPGGFLTEKRRELRKDREDD